MASDKFPNSPDPEKVLATAGTYAALSGILAGFTFTSTISLLQFRMSIVYGDFFFAGSSLLTIIFVFAALFYSEVTSMISHGYMAGALATFKLATRFISLGFIGLLAILNSLTFLVSPIFGIITLVVTLALFGVTVRVGNKVRASFG